MNNKPYIIPVLAAAALLASCSQDDALQSTVLDNEGLKPMTIAASLPTGMQTRAAGDDAAGDAAATRCYVQILDKDGNPLADGNSEPIEIGLNQNNGSFSTIVYLNGSETYDFLFWADTEADGTAAPADLKAVAYTNGNIIAWAGKIDNEPWNANGVEIDLKHVVSRVTVMTESDFTVNETWPFTVTVPTVFSTYNVETEEVTGQLDNGYMFSADPNNYVADAEVAHFYVLGDGSTQKLDLHYEGPLENPYTKINNVPVSADTHITIKGDIYHSGLVGGYITATVDEGWDTEKTEDFDGTNNIIISDWNNGGHYEGVAQ